MTVAGLFMVIVATWLLALSGKELGSNWSARPKARQLVTSGPYSVVRHPVYVFSFLLWVGCFLVLKPAWCWVPLLLIPIQVWRASKEEKVLEEKFGPLWRDYKKRTLF